MLGGTNPQVGDFWLRWTHLVAFGDSTRGCVAPRELRSSRRCPRTRLCGEDTEKAAQGRVAGTAEQVGCAQRVNLSADPFWGAL